MGLGSAERVRKGLVEDREVKKSKERNWEGSKNERKKGKRLRRIGT